MSRSRLEAVIHTAHELAKKRGLADKNVQPHGVTPPTLYKALEHTTLHFFDALTNTAALGTEGLGSFPFSSVEELVAVVDDDSKTDVAEIIVSALLIERVAYLDGDDLRISGTQRQ